MPPQTMGSAHWRASGNSPRYLRRGFVKIERSRRKEFSMTIGFEWGTLGGSGFDQDGAVYGAYRAGSPDELARVACAEIRRETQSYGKDGSDGLAQCVKNACAQAHRAASRRSK